MARIIGLNKISQELQRLPRDVRGRRLANAARAAAVTVRDRAVDSFVPIGKTGNLRESIVVRKDGPASTLESAVYNVGTLKKIAWYGHIVEEGSSKQAAQPFLRPALDVEQNRAVDVMADHMIRALKLR